MALRLADLDEELAFDSIRAGRVRSGGLRGPRGSPPSLEPMRSPNLRVGAYGLCCAQEANPLGAQIHARGGDDTKIHDPDKSDIDKTRESLEAPSETESAFPTRRAEGQKQNKCFAGRNFQSGMGH